MYIDTTERMNLVSLKNIDIFGGGGGGVQGKKSWEHDFEITGPKKSKMANKAQTEIC